MQAKRIRGAGHRPRAGAGGPPPEKVIGLGAPTSVWILFELPEVPALLDAIGDELGRYGCGPDRTETAKNDADPTGWQYHVAELHRMLGDLEGALEPDYLSDRVDVLWPTVLAHEVLQAAVSHAERRAGVGSAEEEGALAAAQRTLRDFQAVDGGGLDVWL
jgi:hypothetical protein